MLQQDSMDNSFFRLNLIFVCFRSRRTSWSSERRRRHAPTQASSLARDLRAAASIPAPRPGAWGMRPSRAARSPPPPSRGVPGEAARSPPPLGRGSPGRELTELTAISLTSLYEIAPSPHQHLKPNAYHSSCHSNQPTDYSTVLVYRFLPHVTKTIFRRKVRIKESIKTEFHPSLFHVSQTLRTVCKRPLKTE